MGVNPDGSAREGAIQGPNRRELFSVGLNAAGVGDLDAAVALFRQVVAMTDSTDADLSMSLGALGHALAERGDAAEAEQALTGAVTAALQTSRGDVYAAHLLIARYFLAEHLLKNGRPADALAAIEPALGSNTKIEPLVRVAQALAAHALGQNAVARQAGQRALVLAGSADQLKSIELRLHPVFAAVN